MFLLFLACTQYLMWNYFDHIFHLSWTLWTWKINYPLKNSILNTYNRRHLIKAWTQIQRTLASRPSNSIWSSKQGSFFIGASGSPGVKFNKSFLVWCRNLTQWRSFLPKGGGMIQVDISGHPPIPLAQRPISILAFFPSFLCFKLLGSFWGLKQRFLGPPQWHCRF